MWVVPSLSVDGANRDVTMTVEDMLLSHVREVANELLQKRELTTFTLAIES